jgi:hypothetical protein
LQGNNWAAFSFEEPQRGLTGVRLHAFVEIPIDNTAHHDNQVRPVPTPKAGGPGVGEPGSIHPFPQAQKGCIGGRIQAFGTKREAASDISWPPWLLKLRRLPLNSIDGWPVTLCSGVSRLVSANQRNYQRIPDTDTWWENCSLGSGLTNWNWIAPPVCEPHYYILSCSVGPFQTVCVNRARRARIHLPLDKTLRQSGTMAV